MNMAEVREHEKISREIEKMSELIRKKYRALKNDRRGGRGGHRVG